MYFYTPFTIINIINKLRVNKIHNQLNNSIKIVVAFLSIVIVVSCSTKKDTFISRNFHSVTTKYNVLYNGNIAFQQGLDQLNSNYEDNYWEVLPIEPLKVDKLAIPGVTKDEDNSPEEFDKAEEKAVKAIQKHSMLILRRERNKQIDDAYLLLGKSRYYSKRFVPSLEAFNYVIINYPTANLINETRIWQSKTHIRLRNEEQAVENLKILLKDKKLNDEIKGRAYTALAMAYEASDSTDLVIKNLKKSIKVNFNEEQKARNLFILGQLYANKKVLDTSTIYFQKIINLKKAPYKYKIHAEIEKAKNVSTLEDKFAAKEALNKLINNPFNKEYLDALYYQLGKIDESVNTESAIKNYKMAIASSKQNNFQKELSFEAIGNIYFDKAQFVTAASYYDSILKITTDDTSKRVFRLKRKRNNLNEVILYEGIAKNNDSILSVTSMSKDEQEAYFNAHIEKLKAAQEKLQNKINTGSALAANNSNAQSAKGSWYFYNNQTVGYGEQEFKRVWGNRTLEDNWRLSDKSRLNMPGVPQKENAIASNAIPNSRKLELSYYLNKIPTTKQQIDSLKTDRDNAYYKLGIIYKEQFNETDLAKEKLEKLLTFGPDTSIELPAKYHLFKLYNQENNPKAEYLKNDILTNYPNSNYAKIILNPNEALITDSINLAESEYSLLFYDYKDEKYNEVIVKSEEAIVKYEGDAIIPKLHLLKAYAIGKRDGILAFKQALDFVAINYPNTDEGKKALEVIETIKTKI